MTWSSPAPAVCGSKRTVAEPLRTVASLQACRKRHRPVRGAHLAAFGFFGAPYPFVCIVNVAKRHSWWMSLVAVAKRRSWAAGQARAHCPPRYDGQVDSLMAVSDRALRPVWSRRCSRSVLVLVAVLAAAVTANAQDAARPNQPAAVEATSLVLEKYVAPLYPPAGAARVQGIVIIEGTVGAAGQPGDVRVLRSVPLLDNAALDAVRQWRFAASGSGTRFTAVVNFMLSNTPAADEAPATSVGWPPADFALYYGFECFGPGGQPVQTSRSVSANDALGRIPPVALTLEERQRLSLLLVQEGFFNIPGAATERERRESVRVAGARVEVTVAAMAPHAHTTSVANSQPGGRRRSADQPELHHALIVRTFGTWRTVEWSEPVADGDERNAEASRVGTAVRAFFRSLPEKGDPATADCR